MKYLLDLIDFCKFTWNDWNNIERCIFVCMLLILLSPFSCSVELKAPETNIINNKNDEPYQVIDNGETKEYIFKKEIEGSVQTITVTGEGVSVVVNK